MNTHFNDLAPDEAERLAMLAEEAGEIVQAVGKILRHGYESHHPDADKDHNNRRNLEREIADLWSIVLQMHECYDIEIGHIEEQCAGAWARKLRFSHHQETE